ncbi:unnamed protein product [Didymodactylos carnosus]|uniref:Uncharacterized protein n=1 Tax=Didymodactylos carnosus TaxID=1234261 RepID=A0A8S2MRY7_9BILA|nr:unnamed protein product [Didymodactylos carnosus]CAF3967366.1 unnamed protein product [Didymodactylos carnosus]
MHDFTALFEALRSMFSSNEQIDTMKAHIIIQNKDNLLNVISNKPRDSTHHDTIARADRDGIQIEGIPERRKLPRTVIEECFALSDLFDIDEHQSLLILLEGESLLPNYPDCTRGLLAVQLYYESKERLSACLAYLMAGIRGRTFQPLIKSEDLIDFCSHFVDELVSQRLIENIVDQLIRFQFSTEEQKLYSKAGLGNVRHRRRVYDYIRNVRCFQSKALFLYSCQVRLNQSHIMAIINYLAKYTTVQEDGVIDDSALYLLGAFLYGITLKTTSATTQSIHKQQFSLQEDQPLSPSTPLTAGTTIDPAFITAIHDTLTSDERWVIPELKAVCQLAWAITLRARLQALTEAGINNAEDIETLADMAVESHVFAFMIHTVIKSPLFQQEEFIIRRFHVLFVDFIYYLPFKLKELRVQAEDTARTIEDCERFGKVLPDNLPRDYEYLLELVNLKKLCVLY